MDLNTIVSASTFAELISTSADFWNQVSELYHVGQEVYLKTRRGRFDHRPYTIDKVLGGGQYELKRDGRCDHTPHLEENLQTEYPERYKVGDEVYLRGNRGIDPKAYKIEVVDGGGQYEISRDGKCDHHKHEVKNLLSEP